ncbi:hypothetical protein BIZ82_gp040 [Erwinia phage vB_EamM_EarlPhillipIV]|uniref:Uncharacterized protein n=1 Tax=Erwinia phage vB_EamM_EarlPhillipIV TaxID=1883372 RepID=A0A1B2IC91_9CAUD|nr:hypothetical protein BIZ82_gp040 [Erwinia phage vB_EamM_EarlPhillipIV]ANZ48890.1 hypothetical protein EARLPHILLIPIV_40 [Erwinia phage vB_EamM_EarlPhillipIV]
MSRRKKKAPHNPRNGARTEIFSGVRSVLRCEDKWKEHSARIGTMIEQERAAIAKMEDVEKKTVATEALDRMYAAYLGWLQHFNDKYMVASEKADAIGTKALDVINQKDIKWKDLDMLLIEPTAQLVELDSEMTNMLMTASTTIMPAIAEYQIKTGDGKDNAEIAEVLKAMNAQPLPEPGFEAVDEDTSREDRADDAFERAAAQA